MALGPVHVKVNTNVTTQSESLADSTKLSSCILEGQINITRYMCVGIKVSADALLTESVTSHSEFMTAISSVTTSYKGYSSVHMAWTAGRSFSKKGSQLDVSVKEVDKHIAKLHAGLVELSNVKTVSNNLVLQLSSVQEKLNKMLALVPGFVDAKAAFERAIPGLQAAIRSQRQRKFDTLTGRSTYVFTGGNAIGLSWDQSLEKLIDVESKGKDEDVFTPLSADKLKSFPHIVDMCHRKGMCGIPGFVVAEHVQLNLADDAFRAVITQLLDVFPLLCVHSGSKYVLVDVTELVFRPGLVHELLTLDKSMETNNLDVEDITDVKGRRLRLLETWACPT